MHYASACEGIARGTGERLKGLHGLLKQYYRLLCTVSTVGAFSDSVEEAC